MSWLDVDHKRKRLVVTIFLLLIGNGTVVAVRFLARNESSPTSAKNPALISQATTTPSPTGPYQMFLSTDGDWEFRYPTGWALEQQGQGQWVLLNSLSPTNSHLVDPQVKFDIRIIPNSEARNLDQLLSDRCKPDEGVVSPLECRKAVLNGRAWVWVIFRDIRFGGRALIVATVANGRIYEATGIVPEGPHESANFGVVRRVAASFVVRDA